MSPGKAPAVIIFFLWLSGICFAQTATADSTRNFSSPHQWNSLVITSIKNPALAGLENKHHFYFDYGRPWYDEFEESMVSNEFNAGYDILIKTFNDKFKISTGVYFSSLLESYVNQLKFGLVHSAGVKFKNNSELSVGFSVLAMQIKTIDYSLLRFGNQFDGTGFNPAITNGETFEDDKFANYGPLNVGAWYRAEDFFAGISVINLTRPEESFFGSGGAEGPLQLYANAGYHFYLKQKLTVTPSLQYKYESPGFNSFQPRLTVSFSKNRFIVGSYYENDAMYGMIGIDLFRHWLINFDAGWFVNQDVDKGMQGFRLKTRVHF